MIRRLALVAGATLPLTVSAQTQIDPPVGRQGLMPAGTALSVADAHAVVAIAADTVAARFAVLSARNARAYDITSDGSALDSGSARVLETRFAPLAHPTPMRRPTLATRVSFGRPLGRGDLGYVPVHLRLSDEASASHGFSATDEVYTLRRGTNGWTFVGSGVTAVHDGVGRVSRLATP